MSEPRLQVRIVAVTPLQQNCPLIWDVSTKQAAFFGQERRSNPYVADELTGYEGTPKVAPDLSVQGTTKRYT